MMDEADERADEARLHRSVGADDADTARRDAEARRNGNAARIGDGGDAVANAANAAKALKASSMSEANDEAHEDADAVMARVTAVAASGGESRPSDATTSESNPKSAHAENHDAHVARPRTDSASNQPGVHSNPWDALRRFTNARIALGRTGDSLPTAPLLAFGLAHAQARDAVHQPLDTAALAEAFHRAGFATLEAASAAPDRDHYLRRPDLGRALDDASRARLAAHAAQAGAAPDIVFVAADGLSAFAAQRHAAALLARMRMRLEGWKIAPVVIATQARVALGDPIGELLETRIVVVMIGERPGLSSPDSLGLYVTYAPRPGRHDAERNCISNVRPEGLSYDAAAFKLHWLLHEARRLKLTGVELKDHSGALPADGGATPALDA